MFRALVEDDLNICADWVLLTLELAQSPPVQEILLFRLNGSQDLPVISPRAGTRSASNSIELTLRHSGIGDRASAAAPAISVSPLRSIDVVPTVSATVINAAPTFGSELVFRQPAAWMHVGRRHAPDAASSRDPVLPRKRHPSI
jgi:hypothetical protein